MLQPLTVRTFIRFAQLTLLTRLDNSLQILDNIPFITDKYNIYIEKLTVNCYKKYIRGNYPKQLEIPITGPQYSVQITDLSDQTMIEVDIVCSNPERLFSIEFVENLYLKLNKYYIFSSHITQGSILYKLGDKFRNGMAYANCCG